jgi:hypothetical protein
VLTSSSQVGGLTNTVGGVVGAAGRGLGETVSGATGGMLSLLPADLSPTEFLLSRRRQRRRQRNCRCRKWRGGWWKERC